MLPTRASCRTCTCTLTLLHFNFESAIHIMYRTILLLTVMVLTACAPMAEFHRPPPPIPEVWPASASSDEKSSGTKTHWKAFFPDPRLQSLITAALEHNRDLRIAVARVEEARAQYGIARADQTPSISLLGSGDLGNRSSTSNSERYGLSLSTVSFELDFWGRLAGLSEAARASYLGTEEARRAVHLSLVAEVAGAYFTLLQMEEVIKLSKYTVELREQSLAVIAKGRDLGGTYDYEFQQASGLLESSRASLAALDHQRAVTENQLNFLVGRVPATLPLGRSLDEQGLDTSLSAGLPAEVLLVRPDVMASEQRLAAAHANIGAARAAFLPKILLTAGLGLASQGLAGLFSGGAWSFQPVISLPLFDGGRIGAGIDIAEARKVIAVAEYEKTLQKAFREVADLLSERASLTRQLRAAKTNSGSQEKRLQIVQARYNAGLVSYLEVLDVQRELAAVQQTTTQVRRAQLDSAAQLYKALGGGA